MNAPAPAGEGVRSSGLASSAAITLVGTVAGGGLTLINDAVTARFLGVETYGSYAVAVALVKVGEIVAVFGAPLTLLRFLPVRLSQSQAGLALGIILAGALAPFTLSLTLACAAYFGSAFVASQILGQPQIAAWIARFSLAIPALAMTDLFGNVARGFGNPAIYVASRNVLPPLIALACVVMLMLLHGESLSVGYGYILAASTGCLFAAVWTLRTIRSRIGYVRPELELLDFYKCAVPLALNAVVTVALLWGDIFVLAAFTEPRTVGVYRACVQINASFDMIVNAFAAATAPILSLQFAEKRFEDLRVSIFAATRYAAFLTAPIMFVLLFNAADILRILGPGFADGAQALAVLALCQFLKATASAASVALVMSGKQGLEMTNSMIAAAVNLGLNFLLVPRLGLYGAAAATGASLLLISLLRVRELHWVWGLKTVDSGFFRVVAASGLAVGAAWALVAALPLSLISGFAALALRLVLSGLFVCAALWFGGLRRDERRVLLDFARKHFSSRNRKLGLRAGNLT